MVVMMASKEGGGGGAGVEGEESRDENGNKDGT